MCVQDYNLAQAAQIVEHAVVCPAGTIVNLLPANKARVGLYILGPDTGIVDLFVGTASETHRVSRIQSTNSSSFKRLMLVPDGKIVQQQLFIRDTSATTVYFYEYLLPLEAQTRLLFAEGRNNK
jgi:hypothetical protein